MTPRIDSGLLSEAKNCLTTLLPPFFFAVG